MKKYLPDMLRISLKITRLSSKIIQSALKMNGKKIIVFALAVVLLSGCAAIPLRQSRIERMSEVGLYTELELSRHRRGLWGKEKIQQYRKRIKDEIIKHNPDWELSICQAILDGRIIRGMNKKQVVASWGLPTDRYRTVIKYDFSDQWIYGGPLGERKYLFFGNDILNSWHEESFNGFIEKPCP